MKPVKDVEQVIREMTERGEFARLGVAPPDVATVEGLVRDVEEEIGTIAASLPKPWDEMTNEEQDAWFEAQGVRMLTPDEVAARYGGYGHTTVTFFGPPRFALQRGSIVMVQDSDGAWHNQMVAVRVVDGVIYVAEEQEYRQAQAEGREPLATAYLSAQVRPAESATER